MASSPGKYTLSGRVTCTSRPSTSTVRSWSPGTAFDSSDGGGALGDGPVVGCHAGAPSCRRAKSSPIHSARRALLAGSGHRVRGSKLRLVVRRGGSTIGFVECSDRLRLCPERAIVRKLPGQGLRQGGWSWPPLRREAWPGSGRGRRSTGRLTCALPHLCQGPASGRSTYMTITRWCPLDGRLGRAECPLFAGPIPVRGAARDQMKSASASHPCGGGASRQNCSGTRPSRRAVRAWSRSSGGICDV